VRPNCRPAPGGEAWRRFAAAHWLHCLAPAALQELPARIWKHLQACRTPALGGALYYCPACATRHYAYHSCNDRHCPQCGHTDADQWLAQHTTLLLPVGYFLVTFTVPEPLRRWMRSHPALAYRVLFAASAQALQDLAQNPRRLGASLGMLGILHTWTRTLVYLSRYVFQTATGNRRVNLLPNGRLRWPYRCPPANDSTSIWNLSSSSAGSSNTSCPQASIASVASAGGIRPADAPSTVSAPCFTSHPCSLRRSTPRGSAAMTWSRRSHRNPPRRRRLPSSVRAVISRCSGSDRGPPAKPR